MDELGEVLICMIVMMLCNKMPQERTQIKGEMLVEKPVREKV